FADGVLLACIGRATKLVERLMGLPKHYRTTFRLGVTNETYDPEQPFIPVETKHIPTAADVASVLGGFVGVIQQVPPAHSAIRIDGARSYAKARGGKPVELAARPVRIDRLDVISYAWPRLELDVYCGRG